MSERICLTGKHGKGKSVLVDEDDYVYMSQFRWHLNGRYAARSVTVGFKIRKTVWMHCEIFGRKDGFDIDHRNGDSLDNRRCNLRHATRSQNRFNDKRFKNNKSGFKGVSWHKRMNCWVCQINISGKRTHLGYFVSPEAAACKYDEVAKSTRGEFARTNFQEV